MATTKKPLDPSKLLGFKESAKVGTKKKTPKRVESKVGSKPGTKSL
ncbi:MAG: hypothetical protein ACPGKS_00985 [Coraliomargarita sp.]